MGKQMNKTELRAACKAAGISYANLTVAGMRDALAAKVVQQSHNLDAQPDDDNAAPLPKKDKKATRVAKTERTLRPESNGVKRPLKGVCAEVWAALDDLRAQGEADLTTAIHARGEKNGWNRNNVSCELSQWRKFNGLRTEGKAA